MGELDSPGEELLPNVRAYTAADSRFIAPGKVLLIATPRASDLEFKTAADIYAARRLPASRKEG